MLFLFESGWNGSLGGSYFYCVSSYSCIDCIQALEHTCTLKWEYWLHISYSPQTGSRQVLAQTQYFPWAASLHPFIWSSSFISTVQRIQITFHCYCSCWLVWLIEICVSDLSLLKKNPVHSLLISYINLMFWILNSKAPKLW